MCGIALVVENAGVKCSKCCGTVLSYQEQCPHRQLAHQNQEPGNAGKKDSSYGPSIQDLAHALSRRGPDSVRHVTVRPADVSSCPADVSISAADISGGSTLEGGPVLHLIGAELQLLGSEVVTQPLKDGRGNVLVFNGEIFSGLPVAADDNDGQKLLEALQASCSCPLTDVSISKPEVSVSGNDVTTTSDTLEGNGGGREYADDAPSLDGDVSRKGKSSRDDVSQAKKSVGIDVSRGGKTSSGDVKRGGLSSGDDVPGRGEDSRGDVSRETKNAESDVSHAKESPGGDVSQTKECLEGDVSRNQKSCRRCGRQTVVQILSSIRGPWAIAYWQAAVRTLWYGRDFVGRRSLVAHLPNRQDSRFVVSSIAVSRSSSRGNPVNHPVMHPVSGRDSNPTPGPSNGNHYAGRAKSQTDVENGLNQRLVDADVDQTRSGPINPLEEQIGKSQLARSRGLSHTVRVNEPNLGLATSIRKPSGAEHTNPSLSGSEHCITKDPVNAPNRGLANPDLANFDPANADPALESQPEGEALFEFWVDVPAGVHSYRPENGAHARHAWEDPLVERLSRWQRERVMPPADVSKNGKDRQADVTKHGESCQADVSIIGEGLQADGPRNGAVVLADVSRSGEGNDGDVSTLDTADVSTLQSADVSKDPRDGTADHREGPPENETFERAVEKLLVVLSGAVAKRVTGIRRHVAVEDSTTVAADVAVLFSGGVDSMVLAALADRHVPSGAQIDLINVCFDRGASPDRQSALAGFEELRRIAPGRRWRLIEVDSSLAEVDEHRGRLTALICPSQTYMDLNIGAALWLAARGQGSVPLDDSTPSDPAEACRPPDDLEASSPFKSRGDPTPSDSRGLGFVSLDDPTPSDPLESPSPSGDLGASSPSKYLGDPTPSNPWESCLPSGNPGTILASKSSDAPSPFETPKLHPPFNDWKDPSCSRMFDDTPPSVYMETPSPSDDLPSTSADSPLPSDCPESNSGEKPNEYNRSKNRKDGQDCSKKQQSNGRSRRKETTKSHPQNACQTDGKDRGSKGPSDGSKVVSVSRKECVSAARVLLVGSGADEQCAGYGRHRTKFREGGWQRLDDEMRLDVLRLWQRNLGRDDRCIADHGKEARFPFLDEDVMSFLLSLPLWIVADLRQPLGVGDKRLLRAAARRLGIHGAAALPKRAIQFGSRIARASNRRDFGSNRAANASSAGGASFRRERAAEPC